MAGDGPALKAAERSADGGLTLTVAVAELFAGLGSVTREVAVAVAVPVPAAVVVPTMVAVAVAPESRVPRLQVTVPEALAQLPWEAEAPEDATFKGSTSVSMAPAVALGPSV